MILYSLNIVFPSSDFFEISSRKEIATHLPYFVEISSNFRDRIDYSLFNPWLHSTPRTWSPYRRTRTGSPRGPRAACRSGPAYPSSPCCRRGLWAIDFNRRWLEGEGVAFQPACLHFEILSFLQKQIDGKLRFSIEKIHCTVECALYKKTVFGIEHAFSTNALQFSV